jgi:hypothetical protein
MTDDYVRHSFKVGKKHTCTLGLPVTKPNGIIDRATGAVVKQVGPANVIEGFWRPKKPSHFSRAMRRDYLVGRNEFLRLHMDAVGVTTCHVTDVPSPEEAA